jgi:hypothetical protein
MRLSSPDIDVMSTINLETRTVYVGAITIFSAIGGTDGTGWDKYLCGIVPWYTLRLAAISN